MWKQTWHHVILSKSGLWRRLNSVSSLGWLWGYKKFDKIGIKEAYRLVPNVPEFYPPVAQKFEEIVCKIENSNILDSLDWNEKDKLYQLFFDLLPYIRTFL
jgi:hypothetical protein